MEQFCLNFRGQRSSHQHIPACREAGDEKLGTRSWGREAGDEGLGRPMLAVRVQDGPISAILVFAIKGTSIEEA